MAFNAGTGDRLWSFQASSAIHGAPSVIDGLVYFAACPRCGRNALPVVQERRPRHLRPERAHREASSGAGPTVSSVPPSRTASTSTSPAARESSALHRRIVPLSVSKQERNEHSSQRPDQVRVLEHAAKVEQPKIDTANAAAPIHNRRERHCVHNSHAVIGSQEHRGEREEGRARTGRPARRSPAARPRAVADDPVGLRAVGDRVVPERPIPDREWKDPDGDDAANSAAACQSTRLAAPRSASSRRGTAGRSERTAQQCRRPRRTPRPADSEFSRR